MSTSKPFDVRVVNSLERPTINDFNLAQAVMRTTVQSLAESTFDVEAYTTPGYGCGFIGTGFKVLALSGMAVQIAPGLGFNYWITNTSDENIDGITGVDVFNTASARPMVLSAARAITLNPSHATEARRDMIAVRRPVIGRMVDQISSDTFNPTAQLFQARPQRKTFTWSFDDATLATLPIGGATTATADIVYIPGANQPYSAPDDFLTYPLSTIPGDYELLAIINIYPAATSTPNSVICDFRPILLPGRALTFPLQFEGGAAFDPAVSAVIPGYALMNYNEPKLPGGMPTPILSKVGGGATNAYSLHVIGYANTRTIAASLSPGGPIYAGNTADKTFNAQVTITATAPARYSYLTFEQTQLLANPLESTPAGEYAVGQPYSQVNFSLGYSEVAGGMNYYGTTWDTTGTTKRLVNGTVTLAY